MGYYPCIMTTLTRSTERAGRQCQVGSLTGAVASQKVTEAPKGSLRMVGNHSQSVKAQASLTARQTGRAGTKVGLSDPVVAYGRAIAQRKVAIRAVWCAPASRPTCPRGYRSAAWTTPTPSPSATARAAIFGTDNVFSQVLIETT